MNEKENKALLLSLLLSIGVLLLHLTYLFVEIEHPVFINLKSKTEATGLFDFFHKPHLIALGFAAVFAIGTKGMKSESITAGHVFVMLIAGSLLYFGAYFALEIEGDFADALGKKAYDQLSGQTASARIPLSRLATKELFWILSGNDFELDINNPEHPAILLLANNPQTQKSYGAIFGLLASTITRVINRKNRIPLSLIIDELPTIYINGLDNFIATARSNKISTLLSFQDLANTIFNTIGNKISGSVVAKTAKKLSEMIGKSVQRRASISYNKIGTTTGTTTTMDYLIPPETIAQLSQGEFCGVVADTFEQKAAQKIFHSKVIADKQGLRDYPIPPLNVMDDESFQKMLEQNQLRINTEIKYITETGLMEGKLIE